VSGRREDAKALFGFMSEARISPLRYLKSI
jgi:hypothetical protein